MYFFEEVFWVWLDVLVFCGQLLGFGWILDGLPSLSWICFHDVAEGC